jgi:hypothetical protein
MGVREVISKFMNEEKWQFEETKELKALRAGFAGKNGRFLCFAKWNDTDDQFTFYAVPELAIPKDKVSPAMEFITRANFGLPVGNFELDLDDGELRFRSGLDVEGATASVPLVRQVVYTALVTLDRYLPGLKAVVEKGEKPKAAVDRIERAAA